MTDSSNAAPSAVDLLAQLTGSPLDAERLEALLVSSRSILEEISRLRAADLTDVHPAVIFDPTAPYRRAGR